MKKLLTELSLIIISLSACQKEPSFENQDVIQKPSSLGQLTRVVEVNGVDSNVINYGYDANGRLSLFDASGTIATLLYCRIVRNPAGLITQTIIKSEELRAIGLDSLVTNFYSNTSTSQYMYSRYDYVIGNTTTSDSTLFVYSGGNLTSAISFDKTPTGVYTPYDRTEYVYSGNNISSETQYDYNSASSTWMPGAPTAYNYDTKVNPLTLGVEGLIIGFTTNVGGNNIIQEQSINSTVITTVAYTYTYNAANKPLAGTRMISSGGNATNHELRFYYN